MANKTSTTLLLVLLAFVGYRSGGEFAPLYDKIMFAANQHPYAAISLLVIIMLGSVYYMCGKDTAQLWFQTKPQRLLQKALGPMGLAADKNKDKDKQKTKGLVGRTARSTQR